MCPSVSDLATEARVENVACDPRLANRTSFDHSSSKAPGDSDSSGLHASASNPTVVRSLQNDSKGGEEASGCSTSLDGPGKTSRAFPSRHLPSEQRTICWTSRTLAMPAGNCHSPGATVQSFSPSHSSLDVRSAVPPKREQRLEKQPRSMIRSPRPEDQSRRTRPRPTHTPHRTSRRNILGARSTARPHLHLGPSPHHLAHTRVPEGGGGGGAGVGSVSTDRPQLTPPPALTAAACPSPCCKTIRSAQLPEQPNE